MGLNLQVFENEFPPAVGPGKTLNSAIRSFKFEPVKVDIEGSNLSRRIKDLIVFGDENNSYQSGSEALFAACLAMSACGFSDIEIVSTLTLESNVISEVAYRRRKSRASAADWILKQNLSKAKRLISQRSELKNVEEVTSKRRESLTFERFEDIKLNLSGSSLVEDLIDHQSLVLLFGETNTGKTFAAIDLAMSIVQGKSWLGKKTERCAVVYIAAEGGLGVKKRIVAYKKKYHLEETVLPFHLATGTIDLRSNTDTLIQNILKISDELGEPIRFVVIDTLSRALAGGDENSSEEMGEIIKCVDLIRAEIKATVLLVHHSGKDKEKGARGHSLLKGAVDTEIKLETTKDSDIKTAKTTKQRDYDYGAPLGFRLESIELQENNAGKMITSCVVQPLDLEALAVFALPAIQGVPLKAFNVLKGLVDPSKDSLEIPLEVWRKEFIRRHYIGKSRQTQSSAFSSAKKSLCGKGYVEIQRENARILLKE